MIDEIKEILNWLNQIIKENKESDVSLNSCVLPFETLYKLQDCITNLQQDRDDLDDCNRYLHTELTNLQEENEKLKKELNTLKLSEEEWLDETLSGDDNG